MSPRKDANYRTVSKNTKKKKKNALPEHTFGNPADLRRSFFPGKCENKWQELLIADDAKNRAAGRLVKKDPSSAERAAEIADKIRDERKSEIKMLLAKIVAEVAQVCFTTVVLYITCPVARFGTDRPVFPEGGKEKNDT